MRTSKTKKRIPIRITPPSMEAQTLSEQPLKEWCEHEETLAHLHFTKGFEQHINRPYLSIRNCTFTGLTLSECQFQAAQLSDVCFEQCDLSNTSFAESSLHRVSFVSCKLVGTNLSESTLNHVSLVQCHGMYLNLAMSKMTQVSFRACDLRQASLNDCRLNASIELPDCTLLEADFSHTSLRHIDLRTARINGIVINPTDLKGAIVNSLQAMDLLPLLGVSIED